MTTFAVLASGPSMNLETADYLRGKCGVIAVSNTFTLAPWADALVSHDMKWWKAYPKAFKFSGRKFCRFQIGVEEFSPQGLPSCCNSGLMGMYVAEHIFKASRILMLGFDMHGTHFFGKHKEPLKNTTDKRRQFFLKQFSMWNAREVINCTPGSAVSNFRRGNIKDFI